MKITVSKHAVKRFRQRVARVSGKQAVRSIKNALLRFDGQPVVTRRHRDGTTRCVAIDAHHNGTDYVIIVEVRSQRHKVKTVLLPHMQIADG